jgi:hypothetical protein
MAQYGYSTQYTGQQVQTLPPGYLEAATAPGRNLAMGIAAMGQGLGKAIEQYRTKKAETEAATQSWETVSGLMQQQLSSDPKYLAIQQYMETGALPQGVTEQDIPRYTQQVQADREMLNKFSALGEKFPDMSLAKKKAALGDAVMVLNQYRTDQSNEVRDAAARQQLALGALQLGTAQREAAAAPYFTQAIADVMSMQPGQGPSAPYADVTQEMLGKYGDKLTPTQMQSLIPMMRRMGQAVPAGLVPVGAKMGPSGLETEYGAPPTIGSTAIPGTRMVQPTVGGKPFGAPQKADIQGTNAYLNLEEPQQKAADKFITDFGNEKTIQNLSVAGSYLNQMNSFGASIGTPQYKPSDDIALIFSFMKTLDPGSTVREGEYATAKNAGSVPESVVNTYNQILSGKFLNDDQRKNFIETARKSYSGIAKEAETVASRYRSMAKDRGIPENLVVPSNMFEQVKQFEAKSQAQNLERFQSPEEMRARGIKRGLVFNPATGKYQEFQD